jgi:hypothetical protein
MADFQAEEAGLMGTRKQDAKSTSSLVQSLIWGSIVLS